MTLAEVIIEAAKLNCEVRFFRADFHTLTCVVQTDNERESMRFPFLQLVDSNFGSDEILADTIQRMLNDLVVYKEEKENGKK